MSWEWRFLAWCICILGVALLLLRRRRSSTTARLPPGPPGWPVFGNMFSLGSMPYKTIAKLKKDYGPIVWLKIGSIKIVALLTAEAATELFRKQDLNFADRAIMEVMKPHDFHKAAVSLAPYDSYWREMKRIITIKLQVQKRINETAPTRQCCVANMVEWIGKEAEKSGRIHVAKFAFLASFNMMGKLILSLDLVNPHLVEGSEFFTAMTQLMGMLGSPNLADMFPWLKWLDPQGLRRKADHTMGKTLNIIAGFVAERLKQRKLNDGEKKDFLEVLLEAYHGDRTDVSEIPNHNLYITILELFFAGSETMSISIEWAMVELLRHPEVMIKAKNELAQVIGNGNKFEEKYIENLPYLQAVIKESLRLHPPAPFLVPRKAIRDTNFMGYHIPKDTQLFVNAWAIGRDPACWEDPYSFKPERFLGSRIDYKGQNYELIPFGAGRRICAGLPLGHHMLHLVLGSLLHEFDWEVDEISRKEMMDTRERMGVTVGKMVPLTAIARKCSTST